MAKKLVIGGLIALAALVAPAGASYAQVSADLGIHFGSSAPQFMPVPSSPVLYAPSVGVNLFSYDGMYYVFIGGGWYVGPGHEGPWTVVRPEFVPRPILAVPVRYYHDRPHEWAHWRHDGPPRWASHYGRHWEDRRYEHGYYRDDRHGYYRDERHDYYRDEHRGWRPTAYRDEHRDVRHAVYRDERREYRGERAPAYRDERRGERHEGHRPEHRY